MTLFQGIFDTEAVTAISVQQFCLVIFCALLLGAFLAAIYSYRNQTSKSFLITLALLPAMVAVVIMMVNGNIGAGVAVAGAFGLVRFRSAPGTAREIAVIFLAMGTGLVTGMGYLGYAVLFTLIMGLMFFVLNQSHIGEHDAGRILHITIPEDLDYANEFDDLLAGYTQEYDMLSVKTTNMGSLFKLSYRIVQKDRTKEKEFIDALRCRNGNLEISISKQETNGYEL